MVIQAKMYAGEGSIRTWERYGLGLIHGASLHNLSIPAPSARIICFCPKGPYHKDFVGMEVKLYKFLTLATEVGGLPHSPANLLWGIRSWYPLDRS